MGCCTPETTCNKPEAAQAHERENCVNCGIQSRPVSRKTVLLMLKSQLLEQASTRMYRFCATRDCSIVYFEEGGNRVFTQDDLRVRVGVKASTEPIPLCYCFGFDEIHLRLEISDTGSTTIPERIANLIRDGLCACEARNPSGFCCLGEVNQAAKRLSRERRISAFT
jgi:Zinc binding domain